MSKSFLNEAFDRKFGFKDISDEIETEELKRPKRKKYSEAAINEADYGGAYDIDPSQYFTRDDINVRNIRFSRNDSNSNNGRKNA